jgi:hypothetical protein
MLFDCQMGEVPAGIVALRTSLKQDFSAKKVVSGELKQVLRSVAVRRRKLAATPATREEPNKACQRGQHLRSHPDAAV